ncbi:hypothetical protein [Streptacidiphilus sp. PAMC 29251]
MTAPTDAPAPRPSGYLQPECSVGRTDPTFRHGCPACPYPGFRHPVLGWQERPCACTHHTAEATK